MCSLYWNLVFIKLETLIDLMKVKKTISFGVILMLTGIYSLFFSPLDASALPIRVLDLSTSSGHSAEHANIHGDFVNTRVSTLSGVNFSDYDVLYIVGEHLSFNPFSGREAAVAAAISSGTLGLIAEADSPWANISTMLGDTVTGTGDVGPNSLTAAGAVHPIFSGVDFGDLDAEDAFSAIPSSGATVLVEDGASNAVMFTGVLGLGRYFVTGTELTENLSSPSSPNDNLLAHNAIHFVAPTTASVPEPDTLILVGGGLAVLFLFYCGRRRYRPMV